MKSENITLIATMKARSGKEELVKDVLLALVPPTRVEKGCVTYILHQDCNDKSLFMFYETWQDRESLDQHLKTPHLKDLLDRSDELFVAPLEITFYNKLC
jgi:quinol monooxygenase YgiN